LRACYTDDSQETYGELLEEFDAEQALESEDLVLDDPQLYSYSDDWTSSRLPSDGDDWTTIFSVLPEIFFSPGNDTISDYWMNGSKSLMNHLAYEMSLLDYQKKCIALQPSTREAIEAAFYDETPFAYALRDLQLRSIHSWLVVADEEAIRTGRVLLVFFDDMGRVVRQGRREASDVTFTEGAFVDGCIDEDETLLYGEPGPAYCVGGPCGPPFQERETTLTLPEGRPGVTDASQRPRTPELGPAYHADRQRVLARQKSRIESTET
jgi:hypothetical protein